MYKWSDPYEWLAEKALSWSANDLYSALLQLAAILDSDTLQDLYQTEMDSDGYFQEVSE